MDLQMPQIADSLPTGVEVQPLGPREIQVKIPAGMVLKDPLNLRIPLSAVGSTRIVVLVGKGASATIVEQWEEGVPAPGEYRHATEIILEDEATFSYVSIQALPAAITLRHEQRAQLEAGSHMHWCNAVLGSAKTEHSLVSTLIGHDARSDVDWLFYAKDKEDHSLNARNVFEAPNGTGEMLMQGVAEDHARVGCKGMIAIGGKGNGTDTYLTQSVLMLDPTAKIDAVPGLEIKTNDVKASHSATVARVTPEDLFYFASRGIEKAEARHLFVRGFLADVAERFPAGRETVETLIDAKYVITAR